MTKRVLYIEDDAPSRSLMHMFLSRANYDYMAATNGKDGLTIIREKRPDAVLLDIRLPDIDGLELIAQLKADPDLAEIPIIGVTATALINEKERLHDLGFVSVLEKPINREHLMQSLADVLGEND